MESRCNAFPVSLEKCKHGLQSGVATNFQFRQTQLTHALFFLSSRQKKILLKTFHFRSLAVRRLTEQLTSVLKNQFQNELKSVYSHTLIRTDLDLSQNDQIGKLSGQQSTFSKEGCTCIAVDSAVGDIETLQLGALPQEFSINDNKIMNYQPSGIWLRFITFTTYIIFLKIISLDHRS